MFIREAVRADGCELSTGILYCRLRWAFNILSQSVFNLTQFEEYAKYTHGKLSTVANKIILLSGILLQYFFWIVSSTADCHLCFGLYGRRWMVFPIQKCMVIGTKKMSVARVYALLSGLH